MGRPAPRPASHAFRAARALAVPATPLAAAQSVWPAAVGNELAAAARPLRERSGELTIGCVSATWAQELQMMEGELLAKLGEALDGDPPRRLRFEVSAD